MSQESRLDSLLSRWQRLRAGGEDLSAETLCQGCPELLPEVRPVLDALRKVEQFASLDTALPEHGVTTARKAPAPAAPAGYELLGELGRGGMGVVYLARQVRLDRLVALKLVLFGEHAGSDARRRFDTEARVVARLSHPNVVQIHEVGDYNGLPYFTLEYCAGGSLADRLARGPMPPREAAELVRTLALAVQAAHEKGIVHRDLKPANILFAADGTPRVADFGLARLTEGGNNTGSGAILGTPAYMAPEQARGAAREVGPRSDVYAMGAVLYECLTGRPPFKAESAVDTLLCAVTEAPTPPRQLRREVPRGLEAICLRCLEKLPARRPGSAKELAELLEAHLAGRTAGRKLGLPRTWRGAAAVALLTLVAGLAVAWMLPWRSREGQEANAPEEKSGQRSEAQKEAAVPTAKNESGAGSHLPGEPTLFGVVAGINDYSKAVNFEGNNLQASVRGATAVYDAFREQKGRFYHQVSLDLLVDEQVTRKAVLDRLLAAARKAGTQDRLLLYLGGTGMQVGGEGDRPAARYQFVCSNSDLEKPETLLSGADIVAALRKFPGRSVVLLDACHSGALLDEPGLDASRHVVLAACGADESALEPNFKVIRSKFPHLKEVRHSLFTLGLLDGLEAGWTSSSIEARELHDHARKKVNEAAALLKAEGQQNPVMFPKEGPAIPIAGEVRPSDPPASIDPAPESATELKKIHVLMLLDTNASELKKSLLIDRKRLLELWYKTIPEDRFSVTVIEGDNATRTGVLDHYKNLRVGKDEGLVLYYGGHGAADEKSKKHFLDLKNGGPLLRDDLVRAMTAKKAELVVLLTDTPSSLRKLDQLEGADDPGGGEGESMEKHEVGLRSAARRIDATVRCLLFQSRGLVDITAATTGSTCWSDNIEGGIFTRVLCPLLVAPVKDFDKNKDGFADWQEFFELLSQKTNSEFQTWRKPMIARGEKVDETKQVPMAFGTLPRRLKFKLLPQQTVAPKR